MKPAKSEATPFANVLAGVGLVPGPRVTASDVVESEKIDSSEPVPPKSSGSKKSEKHAESSSKKTEVPSLPSVRKPAEKTRTARRKPSTRSVTPTSSIGAYDSESTLSNVSDPGFMAAVDNVSSDLSSKSSTTFRFEPAAASVESSVANPMTHSVMVTSTSVIHPEAATIHSHSLNQRTVSPLLISSLAFPSAIATAVAGSSQSQPDAEAARLNLSNGPVSAAPAKKPRRGRTPKAVVAPESPPSSPDSAVVPGLPEQPNKKRKKAQKTPATTVQSKMVNHGERGVHTPNMNNLVPPSMTDESPMKRESLMTNHYQETAVARSSALTVYQQHPVNFTAIKDHQQHQSYPRNGINAPHMLGNQLNPSSSAAQRMSDVFTAEVEAHNVVTHPSPMGNITGVPFPLRNQTLSPGIKMSTIPPAVSRSSSSQSLEELLERQWEQGSQFLMEQAQHYDSKL